MAGTPQLALRCSAPGRPNTLPNAMTCRWPACAARPSTSAMRRRPGVDWTTSTPIVIGKAPDLFEGTMMPELALAQMHSAPRANRLIRVHTAGSVGGSTANVGASPGHLRCTQRVLAIAWEKQSESNAMWALSIPVPFTMPVGAGAGGFFAPHVRSYIRRSGRTGPHRRDRRREGPAERRPQSARASSPARHHRREGEEFADAVGSRSATTRPARRPTAPARWSSATRKPPTTPWPRAFRWPGSTPRRCAPNRLSYSDRDNVNPQAGRDAAAALWKAGGISNPLEEIDVAEIYVPFSWFEPMWLENLGFAPEGEGWKLTEAGDTAIGGKLPVNPSGGVLSSNPIGASGMIRFAEAAIQVSSAPAITRWPARARHSATHTVVVRSTFRCGSSAPNVPPVTQPTPIRKSPNMKFTVGIAMSPLDQLPGIAKTAEECGFSSIALPDSLFFMETAGGGLPVHPGRVSDVERRDPLGRSADRRRRDGRGHREDRVLHAGAQAGSPQSGAARPAGRIGRRT